MKTVDFQGLTIVIENEAGSVRSGTDKSTGKKWEVIMPYPYGFIKDSMGVDGDEIDCFIGPVKNAKWAYIVHQTNFKTSEWDEDKVMLGFEHTMDAIQAYKKAYDMPEHFYASTTTMSMNDFKQKCIKSTDEPMMMHGSALDRTLALFCAAMKSNPFKVGDQVTVDGMHGRGVVYKIEGRRCIVRFRSGEYLSRDFIFLHNMADRVKGMWNESQRQY